jgi:hypothetical protein
VSTNLDQVVALEVSLPDSGRVEVSDTLRPTARALNGHGDSVAADIFWVSLDTAVITVLDSTTGETLGKTVGTGRLEARVDLLRSNPLNVTVITHRDSLQALGATRDTVTVSDPDSLSDSLQVQLFATPAGASGRRVIFSAITFPATGPPPLVTFVPNDSVLSNGTGVATTQLRLSAGSVVPDSVIVTATAQRPDGTPLSSSAMFVVVFRP